MVDFEITLAYSSLKRQYRCLCLLDYMPYFFRFALLGYNRIATTVLTFIRAKGHPYAEVFMRYLLLQKQDGLKLRTQNIRHDFSGNCLLPRAADSE